MAEQVDKANLALAAMYLSTLCLCLVHAGIHLFLQDDYLLLRPISRQLLGSDGGSKQLYQVYVSMARGLLAVQCLLPGSSP